MAEPLAIWLYGARVAVIEQRKDRLRLSYTDEALNKFPLGAPLLSLSLPLASQSYPHGVVGPFVDGLLPEGEPRRAIAADLDLAASDTYGLIRALGRDCAGAIVIQPEEDSPPMQPTTLTAAPLNEDQLVALVRNLRSAPLGIGARVRVSLAGAQEKLLLTRKPDGSWGRPVDGTPSTHILKPEIAEYPHTVENEAFCMRLARHLGLPVASVETTTIGGRRMLVVERYDRVVSADGSVQRIHQEDLCQATGIHPDKKYEEDGGPSLRRAAEITESTTDPNGLESLLRGVTLNVLIGNGDAHGKNFSLLHEKSGAVRLAPWYDLVNTLVYGDDLLAMYVDSVRRTDRVSGDRLVNEAARWGISKRRSTEIIGDVLDRTRAAAEAAREETDGVPENVVAALESQVARIRSSFDVAAV